MQFKKSKRNKKINLSEVTEKLTAIVKLLK